MCLLLSVPLGSLECIEVAFEAILGMNSKSPSPYSTCAWGMMGRKSHQAKTMSRTPRSTFVHLVGSIMAYLFMPVIDTSMGGERYSSNHSCHEDADSSDGSPSFRMLRVG